MNHQSQSVVSWGKTLYQLIVHTLNINFSGENCLTSIFRNALRGIHGHTDMLINDKHVFCECQYLYILRQKITITLTFIKTLVYRFHGSRTTLIGKITAMRSESQPLVGSGWVVKWFLLGYTVQKKWRTSFHTDVLSKSK